MYIQDAGTCHVCDLFSSLVKTLLKINYINICEILFKDYVWSYLLVKWKRKVERIKMKVVHMTFEVKWRWFTQLITKTCIKIKEFWNTHLEVDLWTNVNCLIYLYIFIILFLKDSLMLILPSKNFLGFVCLGEKGEEGDFGGINFPPRVPDLQICSSPN